MAVRLIELKRADMVESVHSGSIAAADFSGKLLIGLGEVERQTFFHSSAKPLQAIAALEAGAVEAFGLEPAEIALLLSSHSGERKHVELLKSIVKKLEIGEEELECGITEPFSKLAQQELNSSGLSATRLHCNCSGKHLGFIAASRLMGFPIRGYSDPQHPLQKHLIHILADFCSLAPEKIATAVDGCGVPAFALPLKNMALAYAHLCDPGFKGGKYHTSQKTILSVMAGQPEMIAGNGRMDTELMRRFGSRVICKTGAEGVVCLGLPVKKAGIAVKVEDGNLRATAPVAMELLVQLGILSREEAGQLAEYWKPGLLNNRGERVGEFNTVFHIN